MTKMGRTPTILTNTLNDLNFSTTIYFSSFFKFNKKIFQVFCEFYKAYDRERIKKSKVGKLITLKVCNKL
jgi:hypothetical protein